MSINIHNPQTGNPTQITVFANGGSSAIHDVAPSVFGFIESAVSIALNIAAVVTGQAYLYFAAAAIDAAQAGQAFSNGQDLQGILSLAQAVGAGIGGAAGIGAGGSVATTPIATQVINAAVQGVGGVYGVVQSAQTGNAAGILAGALEGGCRWGNGHWDGVQCPDAGDVECDLRRVGDGRGCHRHGERLRQRQSRAGTGR